MDESVTSISCKEILEKPFQDGLYSKQQVTAAFNIGYVLGQKVLESTFVSTSTADYPKPYSVLKSLAKGQFALFPYSKWGAVRTAASQLSADFGVRFRVQKQALSKEKGKIKVIRIE